MLRPCRLSLTALALACLAGSALAHDGHKPAASAPPGPASAYAFPLPEPGSYRLPPIRRVTGGRVPEPGSYRLPPIRRVTGGRVLTEEQVEADLATLLRGRITVFSFIYTRCADICPMASAQLAQVRELARRHPELEDRLRLVSMSFDPAHDTPEVMKHYGQLWRDAEDGGAEWLFLTTSGQAALRPILGAYDQAIAQNPDPEDPTGGLNHILRVFLIDEAGLVRNIYSMDFLDPELLLTDIRTLVGGRH